MADGQPGRGSGAGEADEMLSGNIRYEQGSADEKPSNIAAGEKIAFGVAFLHGKVQADAENDCEVDADDHEIDGCKRSVCYRDRRYKQHPCLLGAVVVELAPAYGLNGTSSIVRTGHVCPAKAILLSPPASPLMKAQWKLATAKSITGLVRAQWPSEAEARFIRSPRLH